MKEAWKGWAKKNRARKMERYVVSIEDVLKAARRLQKKEEKLYVMANAEAVAEKINNLELGQQRKIQVFKKGKLREIYMASVESKILQYILIEKIKFRRYKYSFASRRGYSYVQAMKLLAKEIQNRYTLFTDIKDFFPSVTQTILLKEIPPKFRHFIKAILRSFDGNGIPLGNPISGILAEIYLRDFDKKLQFIARHYNFTYIRYMDDIAVICNSYEKSIFMLRKIRSYLLKISLGINESKTRIEYSQAFDYLGYRILRSVQIRRINRDSFLSMCLRKGIEYSRGFYQYSKHSQDNVNLLIEKMI